MVVRCEYHNEWESNPYPSGRVCQDCRHSFRTRRDFHRVWEHRFRQIYRAAGGKFAWIGRGEMAFGWGRLWFRPASTIRFCPFCGKGFQGKWMFTS